MSRVQFSTCAASLNVDCCVQYPLSRRFPNAVHCCQHNCMRGPSTRHNTHHLLSWAATFTATKTYTAVCAVHADGVLQHLDHLVTELLPAGFIAGGCGHVVVPTDCDWLQTPVDTVIRSCLQRRQNLPAARLLSQHSHQRTPQLLQQR